MEYTADTITLLRQYIDDKVDPHKRVMFSDTTLGTILTNSANIYRAAQDCWTLKAAHYTKMLATDTPLTRAYDSLQGRALAMVEVFRRLAVEVETLEGSSMPAVAGKVMSLRDVEEEIVAWAQYQVDPPRG